jgi:hypothetical protein
MRMAKFAIDQDFGRVPRPAHRTTDPVAGNVGSPVV